MADYYGTPGNDKWNGTWEDDLAYGYEGNDKLNGKEGSDFLDGGDGNDTLDGGKGSDSLYGDYGIDKLLGGEGNDYLFGGDSDDKLEGGDGDDYLNGGYLYDTLKGGKGADTFDFDSWTEGVDSIKDFSAHEGDQVQVNSFGFGIAQTDIHRFSFDSHTGALSFDQYQFATLQPNSGFDLYNDLSIV